MLFRRFRLVLWREERGRVGWHAVDADFVVEVGAVGPATASDFADALALQDGASAFGVALAEVGVAGRDAVGVGDHDGLAVGTWAGAGIGHSVVVAIVTYRIGVTSPVRQST